MQLSKTKEPFSQASKLDSITLLNYFEFVPLSTTTLNLCPSETSILFYFQSLYIFLNCITSMITSAMSNLPMPNIVHEETVFFISLFIWIPYLQQSSYNVSNSYPLYKIIMNEGPCFCILFVNNFFIIQLFVLVVVIMT